MKRVLVTSAYSHWGAFSPRSLHDPQATGMIGGGETAMLNLAFQLARHDCEVLLFYDTDRPQHYRGVDFLPKRLAQELVPTLSSDLLLSWEWLDPFSWNHKSHQTVLAMQTNSIVIGARRYSIDRLQAVSNWHVETLKRSDPSWQEVDQPKWFVIPNGVDPIRYCKPPAKVSHRIVYSSSPDRGLHHLFRAWPDIRSRFPDAELHVFYEIQRWLDLLEHMPWDPSYPRSQEVRAGLDSLTSQGVVIRGPVNQMTLAQEHMKAGLLVYPCDTVDKATEGFGITVLEALTAGTPVITTDCDAFPELWSGQVEMLPLPLDGNTSRLVDGVERLWKDPKLYAKRVKDGQEFAKQYTWDSIGDEYYKTLFGGGQ